MDLTLLTVNYNTPDLVVNLLRSVKNTCETLPKVVVMNTSTEYSSALTDLGVPCFNFRGGTHGEAVNLGFKKVKTRYVLLVDSDVLFLQDYVKPFNRFRELGLAVMGKVVGNCAGKELYPRVEPWYCFIDLEQLKRYKINFFDKVRSKKDKTPVYDIGSTMYEDVCNANLIIGDASLENKYFKHYGGMSWHIQKYNPNDIDTDIDFGGTHPNKVLYEHGIRVLESYTRDTLPLLNVNINNLFR